MRTVFYRSILYALCLVLTGQLLTSCSNEDTSKDPDTRLTVNKLDVTVIRTGRLSTGVKPSLSILANRGYQIISDVDWISPDNLTGSGLTSVVLDIKENETGATRTGKLIVSSYEKSETITVTQTMQEDTDDGLQEGYEYLFEDFNWMEQYGGQDQVTHPDQGSTQPLRNHASAVATFEDRGYWDYNWSGNCFYMAKHYLKMGKNNNQTGLTLQLKQIESGKSTNIKLTFDAAPVVSITGTGNDIVLTGIDKTTVTVEKMEGPGTVNDASSVESEPMLLSSVTSWNQWVTMEVTLYGVTADTKIAIRSTQQGASGYSRWYLDNVKMVKAPRE